MATAEKIEKKTIEETVTLTLSREEAETVMTLVGLVGGDSAASAPRKHAGSVYRALLGQGIDAAYTSYVDGQTTFLNKPTPRYW